MPAVAAPTRAVFYLILKSMAKESKVIKEWKKKERKKRKRGERLMVSAKNVRDGARRFNAEAWAENLAQEAEQKYGRGVNDEDD